MTKSVSKTPKKNGFEIRRDRLRLGRELEDLIEEVEEVQE
jgi:hypothetical protein